MNPLNPTLPAVPAIDVSQTTKAQPIQWPSELPPPESRGRRERSGLATGSLPVSSVDRVVLKWERRRDDLVARAMVDEALKANMERAFRDRLCAANIDLCIQEMRAEMARANERQPEENNQGQTRSAQNTNHE